MESTNRKILSALSHGAIFFSSTIVSIAVPIIIFYTTQDKVIKQNAKESLNFHINIYIYAIIFVILIFLVVGIPLLILLAILSFVMPIIAITNVLEKPDKPYRYPFIMRVI